MIDARLLKLGAKGRDVRAVQRALRKAGFRPKPDGIGDLFDDRLKSQVEDFQRAKSLTPVDGEVGRDTWGALEPFVDARGRWLIKQAKKAGDEPTTPRQRIVAAARCGYANRDRLHYTQNATPPAPRRMDGVRRRLRPLSFPEFEDCSSFVTWCYFAAGAPDPNGLGFNGLGFTGTQIVHGAETSEPHPGDLVFYGHGKNDINHVALYVGNGQVISHGGEQGPLLLPLDYNRGTLGGRQQVRSYL